jgi:hypothetical protein
MGAGTGIAGVLYVAIGALQEVVGLAPAVTVTFLLLDSRRSHRRPRTVVHRT